MRWIVFSLLTGRERGGVAIEVDCLQPGHWERKRECSYRGGLSSACSLGEKEGV